MPESRENIVVTPAPQGTVHGPGPTAETPIDKALRRRRKPAPPARDALERKRSVALAVFRDNPIALGLARFARDERELDALLAAPRAEALKRDAALALARRLADEWAVVPDLSELVAALRAAVEAKDAPRARHCSRALLETVRPGGELPPECDITFADEQAAPTEAPKFTPLIQGEL